jgi:hypothetical protein
VQLVEVVLVNVVELEDALVDVLVETVEAEVVVDCELEAELVVDDVSVVDEVDEEGDGAIKKKYPPIAATAITTITMTATTVVAMPPF